MSFVYIVAVGIPWDFQDFPMLKVPPSLRVHCINERFRRLSFIVSLVFVKVNQKCVSLAENFDTNFDRVVDRIKVKVLSS